MCGYIANVSIFYCYFLEGKAISELFINEQIRAKEVRVIGIEGDQLGVMPLADARKIAEDEGVDLVMIAPTAKPPVCRVVDYGKFKYEQLRKEKEARKKQKVVQVKEIRLGIFTEEHDLNVKANNAAKFLKDGDKVKVSLRLRGREMGYAAQGQKTMEHFAEIVAECATVEKKPQLEGRSLYMVLAPKNDK